MTNRTDLDKFKRHPYNAAFRGAELGPLIRPPEIRIESRRHEARNYGDDGSDAESAVIAASGATLTVNTADAAAALALISEFSVGDDVLAKSRSGQLVFSPPEDSGERVLTFPNAFLLPDLEYAPNASGHSARLTFVARPDASGALFTFN